MKRFILTAILCAFTSFAFCQDITLKAGTEATYLIAKGPDQKYMLTLVTSKTVDGMIDRDSDFLKDKVDSNQVKIAFGMGKFGDKTTTLLIIKSGLPRSLKYSAKIKYAGRSRFVNTDVNMIISNVKSMEIWQNDISEIMLSDFEEGSL